MRLLRGCCGPERTLWCVVGRGVRRALGSGIVRDGPEAVPQARCARVFGGTDFHPSRWLAFQADISALRRTSESGRTLVGDFVEGFASRMGCVRHGGRKGRAMKRAAFAKHARAIRERYPFLYRETAGGLRPSAAGVFRRTLSRRVWLVWLVGLLVVTGLLPQTLAVEHRPNIIYIMSDDMGFSDIGCYGSEISTPNLDALAADGLRFTQFYNTARCCPTRACLMTGLYPHQAGVGHMMDDRGYDGYRGDLNRDCVTIAEVLRTAGYRNYMAGKWHVTKVISPRSEDDKHNWPLQRGFDRFYGTIHGAGSFFDPNTLTRDNTLISPYADPEYQPEPFYYTDAISDHAVRFIREHDRQNGEQPFFLYVAYTAAHWPMHALEQRHRQVQGQV